MANWFRKKWKQWHVLLSQRSDQACVCLLPEEARGPIWTAFLQQCPTLGGQAGVPDQCYLPEHWHRSQVYWRRGCHSWYGWFRSQHWNSLWKLDCWLCQESVPEAATLPGAFLGFAVSEASRLFCPMAPFLIFFTVWDSVEATLLLNSRPCPVLHH